MNSFCMKRHLIEESDFQAPLRKRRYVPSGQIVPLDRKKSCFLPTNSTYEMNPIAIQQMHEYDMIRRSSSNSSSENASLSLSNTPAGSDMSMALVVYKRPDLVTPINVNDVDDDVVDNYNKKKAKKGKSECACDSNMCCSTSYCMASPFSSPTASFSSCPAAMPAGSSSGMTGFMTSSPSSFSYSGYSYGYGGYSSSSDGSDMELD